MAEVYPSLVAFFGPDGSGKSTQAELLLDYLKSSDKKIAKAWMRSPHTLAYLLSHLLIRIGFYRTIQTSERKLKYPAVHINYWTRFLWSLIETISVMPIVLFRIYLPISRGRIVVAERCVVDTIVNIAFYTQNIDFLQGRIAWFLLCYSVPERTVFIHLDSDYSAILKRRGKRTDPYEFIEFQRTGYAIARRLVRAISIDTSYMTTQETFSQVLKSIESGIDGSRVLENVEGLA